MLRPLVGARLLSLAVPTLLRRRWLTHPLVRWPRIWRCGAGDARLTDSAEQPPLDSEGLRSISRHGCARWAASANSAKKQRPSSWWEMKPRSAAAVDQCSNTPPDATHDRGVEFQRRHGWNRRLLGLIELFSLKVRHSHQACNLVHLRSGLFLRFLR